MKKLPDNARLMFEGVRYNIYQWEQTLFDGSTAIFEAAKRADSVTVIATAGEMILVLQEEQPGQEPFLALPGGHCEGLTSPEKTARRKLLEEAGYMIHDMKNWFTAPYGWVLGDNYYYIARNVTVEGQPVQDPGDKITPKLISFDEFIEFRNSGMVRNKELLPIFERAANNAEEKKKLHDVIFGTPEELAEEELAARAAIEAAAMKEQADAEAELNAMKAAAQKEAEEKAAKIAALEAKAEEAKRKASLLTVHEVAASPLEVSVPVVASPRVIEEDVTPPDTVSAYAKEVAQLQAVERAEDLSVVAGAPTVAVAAQEIVVEKSAFNFNAVPQTPASISLVDPSISSVPFSKVQDVPQVPPASPATGSSAFVFTPPAQSVAEESHDSSTTPAL
jgi:ADP-ribose pyrophosphatase YjhB (NUDIX family)